jgi:hypothetical protein
VRRFGAQLEQMVLKPLFVKPDQVHFQSVCSRCVDEKNSRRNGRLWGPGEKLDDVTVHDRIDLDEDLRWTVCRYGHRRLVLRLGGEAARNFR